MQTEKNNEKSQDSRVSAETSRGPPELEATVLTSTRPVNVVSSVQFSYAGPILSRGQMEMCSFIFSLTELHTPIHSSVRPLIL